MTDLLVRDALTALAARNVTARWEQMGGNIGAIVVDLVPGKTEITIGDAGDLLTYSDGTDQKLVDDFSAAVYTTDGEQVQDLGTFDSAGALADAVERTRREQDS